MHPLNPWRILLSLRSDDEIDIKRPPGSGSDPYSYWGFFLSLPAFAIWSFFMFADARGLAEHIVMAVGFWGTIFLFFSIPVSIKYSVKGFRRGRTTFAWVALLFSIAPAAIVIIFIAIRVFNRLVMS